MTIKTKIILIGTCVLAALACTVFDYKNDQSELQQKLLAYKPAKAIVVKVYPFSQRAFSSDKYSYDLDIILSDSTVVHMQRKTLNNSKLKVGQEIEILYHPLDRSEDLFLR